MFVSMLTRSSGLSFRAILATASLLFSAMSLAQTAPPPTPGGGGNPGPGYVAGSLTITGVDFWDPANSVAVPAIWDDTNKVWKAPAGAAAGWGFLVNGTYVAATGGGIGAGVNIGGSALGDGFQVYTCTGFVAPNGFQVFFADNGDGKLKPKNPGNFVFVTITMEQDLNGKAFTTATKSLTISY